MMSFIKREEMKMYCSKCGKQIEEDSKFCPFCGTSQERNLLNKEQKKLLRTLRAKLIRKNKMVSFT